MVAVEDGPYQAVDGATTWVVGRQVWVSWFPEHRHPGLFSTIYFQIYKPKNPKIPCCNLFIFTLVFSFIYLLYLSLLDLTLVRDREGFDNPFFVLSASVCLFVCAGA